MNGRTITYMMFSFNFSTSYLLISNILRFAVVLSWNVRSSKEWVYYNYMHQFVDHKFTFHRHWLQTYFNRSRVIKLYISCRATFINIETKHLVMPFPLVACVVEGGTVKLTTFDRTYLCPPSQTILFDKCNSSL